MLDIKEQCDFGESLHSARSAPYYYESVYNFEHRPSVMAVDSFGKCRHDKEVHESRDKVVHTWKCSIKYKLLIEFQVNAILHFNQI